MVPHPERLPGESNPQPDKDPVDHVTPAGAGMAHPLG